MVFASSVVSQPSEVRDTATETGVAPMALGSVRTAKQRAASRRNIAIARQSRQRARMAIGGRANSTTVSGGKSGRRPRYTDTGRLRTKMRPNSSYTIRKRTVRRDLGLTGDSHWGDVGERAL